MLKKVDRAWGWYLVLRETPNTKWKILYFRRGAALSLQRHFKREEKWYFLLGSGAMYHHYAEAPKEFEHTWYTKKAFDTHYIDQKGWHMYVAAEPTIVLEKQMGICEEEDIERARL